MDVRKGGHWNPGHLRITMVTLSCIRGVVIDAEGSFANPLVIDCCEYMMSTSYILGIKVKSEMVFRVDILHSCRIAVPTPKTGVRELRLQ